ncbi:hypothetical protein M413DRAFT_249544 [Hebeloma cylindrosporum]|uniref:Uncharacterized protein n=1 Tax=Hebeloma cylindrosporum TaxID=76867 RepID=A0A0C2YAF5_HEBCY|nr:hypothetical protein M413DRAFT_249544 [Hebeloma cylindrosporum h7]
MTKVLRKKETQKYTKEERNEDNKHWTKIITIQANEIRNANKYCAEGRGNDDKKEGSFFSAFDIYRSCQENCR